MFLEFFYVRNQNIFLLCVVGSVDLIRLFGRTGKRPQVVPQSRAGCRKFMSRRKVRSRGDVRIRVYGTTNVTQVNLAELGGSADAPRDGTPNAVNPGTGKVFWNSDNFTHFLTITLNAATGSPGRYAPLIRPSGHGPKGETRRFTLFLSGSEYAFVWPE